MRRGTRMQPVDAAGLPNYARGNRTSLRSCPFCGQEPPQEKGGVIWKWLAAHLAEHLGYRWSEAGWTDLQAMEPRGNQNEQLVIRTTTRSDER